MNRRILVSFAWVLVWCLLALFVPEGASAADPVKLTLAEAVKMALAQNHELRIARFKVTENEQKKVEAKADYSPQLRTSPVLPT